MNLARLALALKELEARLKIGEESIETLQVGLDAKTIANMEIGTWRTAAGDIDILLGIPTESRTKLARYDQLIDKASVLEIGDVRVAVASLADIIRSKETSDRPKDRAALPELQKLRRQPEEA